MLSNFQINSIANDLKIKLPLNHILMKNELKEPQIGNYVINLQSTFQGKGTHWTCLIIEKDDMFFFDLFGAPPSKEVIVFCKKRKDKHLYYNNSIIQDLQSELCGFYCLGLLFYNKLYRTRFTSLNGCCNSFINLFENETKNNADILNDFFQKFYFRNKEKLINSY